MLTVANASPAIRTRSDSRQKPVWPGDGPASATAVHPSGWPSIGANWPARSTGPGRQTRATQPARSPAPRPRHTAVGQSPGRLVESDGDIPECRQRRRTPGVIGPGMRQNNGFGAATDAEEVLGRAEDGVEMPAQPGIDQPPATVGLRQEDHIHRAGEGQAVHSRRDTAQAAGCLHRATSTTSSGSGSRVSRGV